MQQNCIVRREGITHQPHSQPFLRQAEARALRALPTSDNAVFHFYRHLINSHLNSRRLLAFRHNNNLFIANDWNEVFYQIWAFYLLWHTLYSTCQGFYLRCSSRSNPFTTHSGFFLLISFFKEMYTGPLFTAPREQTWWLDRQTVCNPNAESRADKCLPPKSHLNVLKTHLRHRDTSAMRSSEDVLTPSAVIPPGGLTWSLDGFFGGGVLPFVLNGRGIWHPWGRAVLTEMVLQPLDGAVQLHRADLEVNCHEVWGDKIKMRL